MTTFTEDLATALRARGWDIHHMTEYGLEWWWIPEKHKDYWNRNDGAGDSRDWYMSLQDAVGQALLEDTRAAKAEPLIPRGTGKIIVDEKHGEFEYDSALAVIEQRLEDGYWYENWTGADNPEGKGALMWEARARAIMLSRNEIEALNFLIERRGFEYERFYFEHPEPSPVAS